MTHGNETLYTLQQVSNVLVPVYCLAGSAMFYKWRHRFPIKGRKPMLSYWIQAMLFLGAVSLWIVGESHNCRLQVYHWAIHRSFWMAAAFFLFLRTVLLLFEFKITANILNMQNGVDTEANWYTRNRHLMHRKFFYKMLAGLAVAVVGWMVLVFTLSEYETDAEEDEDFVYCVDTGPGLGWSTYSNAIMITCVLGAAIAAFLMRSTGQDGLFMKQEMGAVAVVYFFVFVGFFGIDMSVGADKGLIYHWFRIGAVVGLSTCTCHMPVLRAHQAAKARKAFKDLGDTEDLATLINSKHGYSALLAFLKTEFSTENLLFWKEAQTHRALPADQLLASAQALIDKYVRDNSQFQINISSTQRQQVLNTLQELDELENESDDVVKEQLLRAIFDPSAEEITQLIQRDSYPRFCRSKFSKELEERREEFLSKNGQKMGSASPGTALEMVGLSVVDTESYSFGADGTSTPRGRATFESVGGKESPFFSPRATTRRATRNDTDISSRNGSQTPRRPSLAGPAPSTPVASRTPRKNTFHTATTGSSANMASRALGRANAAAGIAEDDILPMRDVLKMGPEGIGSPVTGAVSVDIAL